MGRINYFNHLHFFIFLVPFCIFICQVRAVSFDEDVTLTKNELLALEKFKSRMESKLPHDYMKEDIYLIRWLRARQFDVNQAEIFFGGHLKWQKDVNFDRVHEEDFSDLENNYPYELEGYTKDGKPLLLWYLGDWDIRGAAVAGKLDKLMRYTDRMYDQVRIKIREMQQEGKNVTRYTIIFDLTNINAAQHINFASFPYYIAEALSYDRNFPGMGDKIILTNTPGIFQTVLNIVLPLLTKETRDSFEIHGSDRGKWTAALKEIIDDDQIPYTFGGTKYSKFGY